MTTWCAVGAGRGEEIGEREEGRGEEIGKREEGRGEGRGTQRKVLPRLVVVYVYLCMCTAVCLTLSV